MEHEEIFTLMMDALDGELAADNRQVMEAHLRACPACTREWQSLLAIDHLLRQSPVLSPAADFVERTVAMLPNRRARIWAVSAVYGLVLLSGVIPILLGIFAISRVIPVLIQPGLVQSIWDSLQSTWQVAITIFSALLSGLGEAILLQPTLIGWVMVMIGVVFLWSGVYRQLNTATTKS